MAVAQRDLRLSTWQKEAALGCLNFVSGLGALLTSEFNEVLPAARMSSCGCTVWNSRRTESLGTRRRHLSGRGQQRAALPSQHKCGAKGC